MTINQNHADYIKSRKISLATAEGMGLFSGNIQQGGGAVECVNGRSIVFPYIEGGKIVAEKYRSPDENGRYKRFSQKAGGRKTFYNSDILDAPELISGEKSLVIVEGEFDCLAVKEAGYEWVVSVPEGAMPGRDAKDRLISVPETTDDIDPEDDAKFDFILNNSDRLFKVKRIILAMDNDESGQRMAKELARRVGHVRCLVAPIPSSCKDVNDVLVKYGKGAVLRCIQEARLWKIDGIFKFSDAVDDPEYKTISTGWHILDENIRLAKPGLMVVTGRANEGKSTWTTQLVTNVSKNNGWKIVMASFEMHNKYVFRAIGESYHHRPEHTWDGPDRTEAEGFIQDNFTFVKPPRDGGTNNGPNDLSWLINRCEAAIIRYGADVVLIDPWNEIEHTRTRNESLTEYTNRAVMELKRMSDRWGVLVIIVAHPTKSGASKEAEDINLYDISDSAAFANKADIGVVISRVRANGVVQNETTVNVVKSRLNDVFGMPGSRKLAFDLYSRTFV